MRSRRFRSGRPAVKALASVFVALGMLAATVSPAVAAETSIFIAYSAKNFGGKITDINGCGVHNMPYAVGSYQWLARGQSGRMYNVKNAAGATVAVLGSGTDASSSKGVGWKSIFIVC